MVKIRLRRMGQKHRPFYRIVVAKSTAGRGGSFIEILGTYNPVSKPSTVVLNGERSLEWLLNGAQPTETVAYLLRKEGVLDKFFEARPNAKGDYKFLDKRTAMMSKESVMKDAPKSDATAPVDPPVEAPVVEAAPVEAAPVAEEPVAEAPVAEAPVADEPAATEPVATEPLAEAEATETPAEKPAEEA